MGDAEVLLRRFLDTDERGDFATRWTFCAGDCRFPVLERFGIDPARPRYQEFVPRWAGATISEQSRTSG